MLDLERFERLAHQRINMPGAPWITGTEVLALVNRIRHLEGKLHTIEILTHGSREVEGLNYLAESALEEK